MRGMSETRTWWMVQINLVLWLAVAGFMIAPTELPGQTEVARWLAIAGAVMAAAWEHAVVRGRKSSN